MLALVACGGLLLPLAVPLQPRLPHGVAWLLDLAVHWQWLWLALLAMALALCAAGRAWRWLVLAAFGVAPWWTAGGELASGSSAPSAPSAFPASPAEAGATLTIASVNVQLGNSDPRGLVQWARALEADVLVVLELSPAMARALEASGATDYPHRSLLPADHAFGIALLARHPLRELTVLRLEAGVPALHAVVETPAGPVSVAALHTMPPVVGPQALIDRDRDIARVARHARAAGGPAIVAGDLNATAWSSGLRAAQAEGFGRAQGLAPTWPQPVARAFGIPIDHVLADHRHWRVVESGRGPDVGSDHLPVYARLRLVNPASSASPVTSP